MLPPVIIRVAGKPQTKKEERLMKLGHLREALVLDAKIAMSRGIM